MTNRRVLLKSMLAGLGLGPRLHAKAAHPNVILCMADDQGWGDVGYNGHPYLETPNLDAMSRAGIRFDRFYAGAPVCSPTRGSALTGRHPFRYGIYSANVGHIRKQEITLAEALGTQGYATGHFGKWHLGTLTNEVPDGRRGGKQKQHYSPPWENGFEVCFSTEQAVPTWDPMKNQPIPTRYWTGPGQYATENLEGDDSRVIMDRALPFLRKAVREQRPFLAVIWFHAPHAPVVAGSQYRAKYSRFSEAEQHYYGCITALDEQMGRLRKELRTLGVAGNTMLWYCSDNGPEGREHYSGTHRGSAGGLRGRKRSLFEGGIRVPGILEWPDRVKQGRGSSIPCCTSDYYPTVMDALGLGVKGQPEPIDGISLLPLIEGKMRERPRPIAFETDNAERGEEGRLGSPPLALIDNRFKFLSYLDDARQDKDMLFDIAIDPGERFNMVKERPEIAGTMRATLLEWRASCRRSDRGEDYDPKGSC